MNFNRRYEIIAECANTQPNPESLAAALEPLGIETYMTTEGLVHFPGKVDTPVLIVSTILNGEYDPLESLGMSHAAGAVAKLCGADSALLTVVPIQTAPVDTKGHIIVAAEPGVAVPIAQDGSVGGV